MKYILSGGGAKCIFCEAVEGDDRKHWVIARSKHSIAVLNIFPYNTAHVMVAPKSHIPRPDLLSRDEVLDLHSLVILVIKAIDREYKPHGYNVGMNIGKVAGAGIESHLHIHIVPRWLGDTNYMPVIGLTKVMPEDLTQTYERIRRSLESVTNTVSTTMEWEDCAEVMQ